jgi:hypothetical protein
VEKKDVKIEDSAKRGKEDEKYIENEDDDTQDLDLQEYDKMIKCNSSDDHQQVIIKVENMEGGFDEKSNKLSNSPGMAENSNASMFLMSSENNPCLESPDVQKRSPGSSKTKTKPHTAHNYMVDDSVSYVSLDHFLTILNYIFYTIDILFHAFVLVSILLIFQVNSRQLECYFS